MNKKNWIIWTIITIFLFIAYWPAGLAVIIGTVILRTTKITEKIKQVTSDIHTIAENTRKE